MRTCALLLALLAIPSVVSAQRLQPVMPRWSGPILSGNPSAPALKGPSHDYRIEGMIVGAAVLGGLGYWLGHAACEGQPDPTGSSARNCTSDGLVVGLIGGALGAGLGYLAGRSITR